MVANIDRWLITHLLFPLLALCLASICITVGDVDRGLADYFYGIQGNSWAWKDHWITETFFHRGGRNISLFLLLLLLVFLVASHFISTLQSLKKPLFYLFLATAGSSLLISCLKALLAVSCPWEFYRYGGDLPYLGVVDQLFQRNGSGCFPAGQASAGYAWISCYFFGVYCCSKWRWLGLVLPLIAGSVLGLAQQIRGAHFISHDLWSAAICWFFSLTLFFCFFGAPAKQHVGEVVPCL
ncbi:MAG: phosphatase PAP2 family protein [Cellvibrio sp.]|uniref:phosphatase PAP2 family protein n=1 Tax=Cellvibrio sp. TaxID=1965322 RepID=UPI0031AC7712